MQLSYPKFLENHILGRNGKGRIGFGKCRDFGKALFLNGNKERFLSSSSSLITVPGAGYFA